MALIETTLSTLRGNFRFAIDLYTYICDMIFRQQLCSIRSMGWMEWMNEVNSQICCFIVLCRFQWHNAFCMHFGRYVTFDFWSYLLFCLVKYWIRTLLDADCGNWCHQRGEVSLFWCVSQFKPNKISPYIYCIMLCRMKWEGKLLVPQTEQILFVLK